MAPGSQVGLELFLASSLEPASPSSLFSPQTLPGSVLSGHSVGYAFSGVTEKRFVFLSPLLCGGLIVLVDWPTQ